jgi:diamine N-acetyltransferase
LTVNMGEIVIREAIEQDAEALAEIGSITFYEAFAAQNNPVDMAIYIEQQFNVEKVREELKDPKNLFLMVDVAGELAAYTKVRFGSSAQGLEGKKVVEIERIYVLNHFQALGIGASLLSYITKHVLEKGVEVIWLGVWEQNHKAIRFYRRWGFEVFGSHVFMLGTDAQNDLMMKKEL